MDATLLLNCRKPPPFSCNTAIRGSQGNSWRPPARRERDGPLSDTLQVSPREEARRTVAGQPRRPLRGVRDGERGHGRRAAVRPRDSSSNIPPAPHASPLRLSLTLRALPPRVLHDGHQEAQAVPCRSDRPDPRSPPAVPPASTPRVLYGFYGNRNASLLLLYFLCSLPPRLSVTIGSGACGSGPCLAVGRDDFRPFLSSLPF